MKRIRWMGAAWVGVLALAWAGMAWAQEAERTDVRIELGEFYFQVEGQERNAAIVVEAGQPYTLTFVNVGAAEHEVLIGREVQVEDGVPDGYAVHLLDDVVLDVVGDDWMVRVAGMIEFELEAGESVTLEVTIPEDRTGTWEIGCFIPGHYQAGMKAPVEVR